METLFQTYLTAQPKEQEAAAKELVSADNAPSFLLDKLHEKPRAALALLARASKRDAAKEDIAHFWRDVAAFLNDEDAKTRKNAAVLLGSLEMRDCAPLLAEALREETQEFVRPSMILALGSVGGKQARDTVQNLPEPQGVHEKAEREAIEKALSRLAPAPAREFTGFGAAREVILAPVSGLFDSLAREALEQGIGLRKRDNYAAVFTDDYGSIFGLRCFMEAMLPIETGLPFHAAALADTMQKKGLFKDLTAMHDGEGSFSTRLELRARSTINRREFASTFFSLLDSRQFSNSPSSYDIEIRFIERAEGTDAYVVLHSYQDKRFDYRLGSVAASINPAAAAAALRIVKERMRPDAAILDPFCGSATMLIERKKLLEGGQFHGVDIDKHACAIARRNSKAAHLPTMIYNRSAIGFRPEGEEGYDEIYSNMPFGNRVGNHQGNEKLYASFFAELPTLLKRGGFMLAITNEKVLLKQCVRNTPRIGLIDEVSFSYGGLNPSAFLIVHE